MPTLKRSIPLFLVLITGCAAHAYAGLIGSEVTSQYYDYGGPYNAQGSPVSFTANGTVQQTFCSACQEGFNLTVTDNVIEYVLFGSGGDWSTSIPSLDSGGLYIANGNLLTFSGVTITGVTLDPSSNVPGFTAANVTFNANNVAIDWAGLSGIAPGDQVFLDVTTGPATAPEPATWMTMLAALTVAGAWRRLRTR
jgi:hypothetical protein